MYNPEDDTYDKFHYYCKNCGYDRGVLDHSQYSTVCPECGSRYYVEPVIDSSCEVNSEILDEADLELDW